MYRYKKLLGLMLLVVGMLVALLIAPRNPSAALFRDTPTPSLINIVPPVELPMAEALGVTNVRAVPDINGSRIAQIAPGTLYEAVGKYFQWYAIVLPDSVGWVYGEVIKLTGDTASIPEWEFNQAYPQATGVPTSTLAPSMTPPAATTGIGYLRFPLGNWNKVVFQHMNEYNLAGMMGVWTNPAEETINILCLLIDGILPYEVAGELKDEYPIWIDDQTATLYEYQSLLDDSTSFATSLFVTQDLTCLMKFENFISPAHIIDFLTSVSIDTSFAIVPPGPTTPIQEDIVGIGYLRFPMNTWQLLLMKDMATTGMEGALGSWVNFSGQNLTISCMKQIVPLPERPSRANEGIFVMIAGMRTLLIPSQVNGQTIFTTDMFPTGDWQCMMSFQGYESSAPIVDFLASVSIDTTIFPLPLVIAPTATHSVFPTDTATPSPTYTLTNTPTPTATYTPEPIYATATALANSFRDTTARDLSFDPAQWEFDGSLDFRQFSGGWRNPQGHSLIITCWSPDSTYPFDPPYSENLTILSEFETRLKDETQVTVRKVQQHDSLGMVEDTIYFIAGPITTVTGGVATFTNICVIEAFHMTEEEMIQFLSTVNAPH